MVRLAYVCADPGIPVFGRKGASVHVQEVVRAMRQQGIGVDVFACRIDGTAPVDLADVPVHRLPLAPRGDVAAREQAALRANEDLRQALGRCGPYDLIYERYSLWSFAGMEFARDHSIPGILEVNAPLIDEQSRHRALLDRATAQQIARQVFTDASSLIAVSGEIAAYVQAFGAKGNRVHVIPNGVNTARFHPAVLPSLPAENGLFTVGFVGTLKPWHDLGTLADAFEILHRRIPQSRLLIVGDGGERGQLAARLAACGLADAAHFTGAVNPAQVPGLLASMDVAVAPYQDLPGFYFSPLKVYEYMAAGVPVVASSVGQLPAALEDGACGLLTPPGDAAALATACERLHGDAPLRVALATTARARVLAHSWEAVVRRSLATIPLPMSANRVAAGGA